MSTLATVPPALRPAADWPMLTVVVALGLAALMAGTLGIAVVRRKGKCWLINPAPSPKWSFESWATHLTAIGAVLGTVLGSASLPESPTQIDKESLVGLSLLFGALVVVAPFIFEAIRRPVAPTSGEGGGSGFVGVLLLSCAITFGAVFGEIFTLGLAAWELTGGDAGGVAIEVGLGLLSILALYYVAVTAWEAAMTDWSSEAQKQTSTFGKGALEPAAALAGRIGEDEQPVRARAIQPRASWSLP
jgi:hypothetical protein